MIISTFRPRSMTIVLLCCALLLPAASVPESQADTPIPFIDAHTHLLDVGSRNAVESGVPALRLMDKGGVILAIVSPPPSPARRSGPYGARELQALVRRHPGRFAFTAGGENLNPMIQETPPDRVTPRPSP